MVKETYCSVQYDNDNFRNMRTFNFMDNISVALFHCGKQTHVDREAIAESR